MDSGLKFRLPEESILIPRWFSCWRDFTWMLAARSVCPAGNHQYAHTWLHPALYARKLTWKDSITGALFCSGFSIGLPTGSLAGDRWEEGEADRLDPLVVSPSLTSWATLLIQGSKLLSGSPSAHSCHCRFGKGLPGSLPTTPGVLHYGFGLLHILPTSLPLY